MRSRRRFEGWWLGGGWERDGGIAVVVVLLVGRMFKCSGMDDMAHGLRREARHRRTSAEIKTFISTLSRLARCPSLSWLISPSTLLRKCSPRRYLKSLFHCIVQESRNGLIYEKSRVMLKLICKMGYLSNRCKGKMQCNKSCQASRPVLPTDTASS